MKPFILKGVYISQQGPSYKTIVLGFMGNLLV
jgi:hypothetical protein